jgi:hypothetical protein
MLYLSADIMRDPVVTNPCEHYFCQGCIVEQIRVGGKCPMDNAAITLDSINTPTRFFMNIYSSLQIKCRFREAGCPTVTDLGNLTGHEDLCGTTQCLNARCQEQVLRRDLHAHSTTTCDWRTQICEHGCGKTFPFVERNAHEENCPKKMVKCSGSSGW